MGENLPSRALGTTEASDLTGTTVGRFEIRARLGAGGMGEVYRAEDTVLKRPVALKRMAPRLRDDPVSRQRFLREAERASRLSDAHIAGIYDVLQENGEVFLVMEYIEGETLRRRLNQPMPFPMFLEFAVQCAQALVAAHDRGILHRDIKPENIMLTATGQAKVLDFGVAREILPLEESPTVDGLSYRSAAFSGTLAYMAPEILMEQEADGRADIFSLGVVLYETLTGHHPFRSEGVMATADRIRHQDVLPASRLNSAVPAEMDRILAKMLAKNRDARYATAADLGVDLRALRGKAPVLALPLPTKSRRPLVLAAGGLVLLVVLMSLPAVRERVVGWFRSTAGRPPAGPEMSRHLVVLPFTVTGNDKEAEAFAEGLRETLTTQLSKLSATHSLQVSPASEVGATKVSSAQEARRTLGAGLVLLGNVQIAGAQVRVNLNLMDTSTRQYVDTRTVTADATDPFAFQDQVVGRVLEMLELNLQAPERRALGAVGPQVAGAYELYLRGRGYLQAYQRPENLDRAIAELKRALELDPNFALTYAGLGEAYLQKYERTKEARWVDFAHEACEDAVALEPKGAAGLICIGNVHVRQGEYDKAVAELRRALEIEPTSDDAYRALAIAHQQIGNYAEAEATYQQAITLRPSYWAGYTWLGHFYSVQSRYPEAIEQFERAVALSPDNATAYAGLGGVRLYAGDYEGAAVALSKAISLRPTWEAYSNLGVAHFTQRKFPEAVGALEEAFRLNPRDYRIAGNLARACYWAARKNDKVPPPQAKLWQERASEMFRRAIEMGGEHLKINARDADVHLLVASYHAMLGARAPALEHLRRALQLRPNEGEYFYWAALIRNQFGETPAALDWLQKAVARDYSRSQIEGTVEFDNLRADPRFQELVRSAK